LFTAKPTLLPNAKDAAPMASPTTATIIPYSALEVPLVSRRKRLALFVMTSMLASIEQLYDAARCYLPVLRQLDQHL
jgi:hypothetical protein